MQDKYKYLKYLHTKERLLQGNKVMHVKIASIKKNLYDYKWQESVKEVTFSHDAMGKFVEKKTVKRENHTWLKAVCTECFHLVNYKVY